MPPPTIPPKTGIAFLTVFAKISLVSFTPNHFKVDFRMGYSVPLVSAAAISFFSTPTDRAFASALTALFAPATPFITPRQTTMRFIVSLSRDIPSPVGIYLRKAIEV